MKKYFKTAFSIAFVLLLNFMISSCGCVCDCVKGLDCANVSVLLIANDSLILQKEYCQGYNPYDDDKIINDSINELTKLYPPSDYKIISENQSRIFDKIRTKKCNGNPADYHCDCYK